ncbi:MAG: hypothetical protein DSY50_08120 [Desulfobulbus sp.]|nr:MAG: hypothetical protein DSY50_08120 [Desulfobulbus sp.]
MLDKSTAAQEILRRYRTMECGDTLQLLTWKRDRSLLITKQQNDEILIQERGFKTEDFLVSFGKLKKILKVLLKREFPRSHKIRTRYIYQHNRED